MKKILKKKNPDFVQEKVIDYIALIVIIIKIIIVIIIIIVSYRLYVNG